MNRKGGLPGPQGLKPASRLALGGAAEAVPFQNKVTIRVFPLKRLGENSVVPPGLESFFLPFPALKRWAKLGRPSGTAVSPQPVKPCPCQNHL